VGSNPTLPAMSTPVRTTSRVSVAVAAVLTAAIGVSAGAQTGSPVAAGRTTPRIVPLESPATALIQAVHAVDPFVIWASGHKGHVLRSRDGGHTWERLETPVGDSLEFRDVHAVNADTAWILSAGEGPKSRIYRTTNGGATWKLQFINSDSAAFYDCLSFGSSRTGVAYGDASQRRTNLLRTDDAGETWRLLTPAAVPEPLPGEGAFAASGLCVVHADANTVFVATGTPGSRLFRSRDAGKTWTAENTPFARGISTGLSGMSFATPQRGIVVAGDMNRLRTDSAQAVVGITTDGGRTWDMRSRPPRPGALAGVTWVPNVGPGVAVAVGFGGAFYTLDEGRTWQTITTDVTTGVSAHGRQVWIGGANGKLWRVEF
jgi:photosystem II stability/assembly factor-like uncharacterized protein